MQGRKQQENKNQGTADRVLYNKCILRAGVFYFFCIARDENTTFRFILDSVTCVCATFMYIPLLPFSCEWVRKAGRCQIFFLIKIRNFSDRI